MCFFAVGRTTFAFASVFEYSAKFYRMDTATIYRPAGECCTVNVVLGKDLINQANFAPDGSQYPDAPRSTGESAHVGTSENDKLRRYKHCGQFVVTLELLPESITNEGRITHRKSAHTSYRADRLNVVDIRHITGYTITSIASDSNDACVYRVGGIIRAPEFWMDGDEQCCPWGIHYFRTMEGVYGRMLYRNRVTLEELQKAGPVVDRAIYWDSLGVSKLVDCRIAV